MPKESYLIEFIAPGSRYPIFQVIQSFECQRDATAWATRIAARDYHGLAVVNPLNEWLDARRKAGDETDGPVPQCCPICRDEQLTPGTVKRSFICSKQHTFTV